MDLCAFSLLQLLIFKYFSSKLFIKEAKYLRTVHHQTLDIYFLSASWNSIQTVSQYSRPGEELSGNEQLFCRHFDLIAL